MAPPRGSGGDVGERLARVEARLEASDDYAHERWHKLNNDLQPLMNLPERLARDMGKMQGLFDGKLGSVTKELERSMEAAISKALVPVTDDVSGLQREVADLRKEIEALKTARNQLTGAKIVILWLVQTIVTTAGSVGITQRIAH